jgi:hypothetical protein
MLAVPHRRSAWAVLAALLLAGPLVAASPRDELLRYVPDDAGFCLVVQNLRGHAAEVLASPFARAWGKSSLAAALERSPELKQLRQVEASLRKRLGVDGKTLRDDLLGEAFVFAYRLGPAGKPDEEQGLFLVRARDGAALAAFVEKLNALQKKTGELKDLVACEHKGVKYVRRVGAGGGGYYLLRGPVLLYTGQEPILRSAIDRDRTLAADAAPPWARRLEELGLQKALAAVALNPRVFDEAMAAKAAKAAGGRTFLAGWRALQGAGLGVHLARDLRVTLTLKAEVDRLPASARRALGAAGPANAQAPAFPADALFAAVGKLDVPGFYELLGEFMPGKDRAALAATLQQGFGAALGKDVAKDVLPALGPDWGLCVTAPPAGGKEWAPRVLFALRAAEGASGDPTDEALLAGVHLGAQLVVLGHNKTNPSEPMVLRTTTQDRVRVRYLEGKVFPAGVRPAFALKGGYLVLASSPAEVRRFKLGPAGGPLLRVSARAMRSYLKEHRDALAAALAHRDRLTKEQAAEKIDGLRNSLELIDRIELSGKTTAGGCTWTLAVQPVEPLKKGE